MLPRMTNMHAEAPDAFEHTLDSAGALAFVNEYSGSAAPPAPYNAFAERKHACPYSPLSHPVQEVTRDASTSGGVCGLHRHRLGRCHACYLPTSGRCGETRVQRP